MPTDACDTRRSLRARIDGRRIPARAGWLLFCVLASSVLVYAYLALGARSMGPDEYGRFAAFWSLALVINFGVYLPLEQELSRVVPGMPDAAAAIRPALGAGAGLTAAVLAVLAVANALLLDVLGGESALVLMLAAVALVSVPQFLARGLLLGTGETNLYGSMMLLDAVLRVLFALVVIAVAPTSGPAFALALVIAVAAAHLPFLLRFRSPRSDSGPTMGRAVAILVIAALCAQGLQNGPPALAAVKAGSDQPELVGQFLTAFLVVRIPLFFVVPLQSVVVPPMVRLATRGPRALSRALGIGVVVLLSVGAVYVVVAGLAGPAAVSILFGSEYALTSTEMALLAAGVVAQVGLVLTSQALVATRLHRIAATVWVLALAAAVATFAGTDDPVQAASLAFLVGSLVGWVVGLAVLLTPKATRRL